MLRAHLGPFEENARRAGGRAGRQAIFLHLDLRLSIISSQLVSSRLVSPLSAHLELLLISPGQPATDIIDSTSTRSTHTHRRAALSAQIHLSSFLKCRSSESRAATARNSVTCTSALRVPRLPISRASHRIGPHPHALLCPVYYIVLYFVLYVYVLYVSRSERRRECSGGLIRSCRGASDGAAQMLPIIVSPDAQLSARLPSRRLIRDAAVAALATPALASARELLDAGYS